MFCMCVNIDTDVPRWQGLYGNARETRYPSSPCPSLPSTPQGTTPSVLRLAQVSATAVFAVGAALYAVSRFFKGSANQPLPPMDLASSYGTRTSPHANTRAIALASILTLAPNWLSRFLIPFVDPVCKHASQPSHNAIGLVHVCASYPPTMSFPFAIQLETSSKTFC